MHNLLNIICLTMLIQYKQITPIKIEGPNKLIFSYQEIINQKFIDNFKISLSSYEYYFSPCIDYRRIGNFEYELTVFNDYSYGQFYFELEIMDTTKPIIYGMDNIRIFDKKDYNQNDILKYYYGEDEIDGRLDVFIQDYIEKNNKAILKLYCEDKSNNVETKNVDILFTKPNYELHIKQYQTINLKINTYYTAEDIIKLLMENYYLEKIEDYDVEFKETEKYLFSNVGLYDAVLNLYYKNNTYPIYVTLNALEDKADNFIIHKIFEYISRIFKFIGGFLNEK